MANVLKAFRLEKSLVSDLLEESEKRQMTLSHHVNNILKSYNSKYRYLEQLHHVWLSPEMVKEMLNAVDTKELRKISEVYSQNLKKQVIHSMEGLNSHAVMGLIENNCLTQDIPFNKSDLGGDAIRYSILHTMGDNWSILTKTALENLLGSTKSKIFDFDYNGEYLSFTVRH